MLPVFAPSFHLCVCSEVQSRPGVNSQEPAGEAKHYKHSTNSSALLRGPWVRWKARP